ncbi:MAG: DNA translocase FtsK 4TM domain-containing protein [Phototrophicaceae bacterium]
MAEESKKPTPAPTNPDPNDSIGSEFWDFIFDSFPPWIGEIGAFILVLFGILSLLSVFNVAGDAFITNAWANAITTAFGYGSIIVSIGILCLGIALFLPNMGIEIQFPLYRVVATEVWFLSTQALMHLFVSGTFEMRALARSGKGGGLVGWALSAPIVELIGSFPVSLFYLFAFAISFAMMIGVTHSNLKQFLEATESVFLKLSERLAEEPNRNRVRRRNERLKREAAIRYRASRSGNALDPVLSTPILHIKPNLDHLPPSLRKPSKSKGESADEKGDIGLGEHPLFNRAIEDEKKRIIGEVIQQPKRKTGTVQESYQEVRRPDGRIKRYFSLSAIKETKKSIKRKADAPPLTLLADVPLKIPNETEINTNVVLIENTLLEFDIDIDVIDVQVGPTVTQYAVRPYREGKDDEKVDRTRISKIASYQSDLALSLSSKRLRIEAPVPGTNFVGIEVPNKVPSLVALRSVYESQDYQSTLKKAKNPLIVPLGRDVAGNPFAVDFASMPHTLVAGTTGSGKSVCLAAIVMALVLDNTPDELQMVLLDPKMVELSRFNGLPHLLGPVETDGERIIGVLRWCTREMDRRYKLLETAGVRNISLYNEKQAEKGRDAEPLPYILIMIDEVGDLMMNYGEDTEHHLTRLAQMARAVGMHMIVATQRPSVDVLTGLIKANFPGRIAFSVASSVDSRVILDASGAESLLGNGDMLFLASDASGPKRIQGCFVSDDEVRQMVQHWRDWASKKQAQGDTAEKPRAPWEKSLTKLELLSETDDLLAEALEAVIRARQASATMLQKHLNIGYPRAARIMDLLFELGAIGPPEPGGKMRRVLISATQRDPLSLVAERHNRQNISSPSAEYADEDDDDDFHNDDDLLDEDEPI